MVKDIMRANETATLYSGYPQVNTVQIIGTSLRRGTFVYTQESISICKTLIKQLYWMVDYCTF